jgi:hypothetical protein
MAIPHDEADRTEQNEEQQWKASSPQSSSPIKGVSVAAVVVTPF